MADTSPSTQRRATRTMNIDQHPGLAIPVRKRCTKAEMAQDKALQEEKKAKKKTPANEKHCTHCGARRLNGC